MLDGEVYKSYQVEAGSPVSPEPAPVKEGYTFSGWDDVPATMPDHDVTVSGSFSLNSYNAVFRIGEEFVESLSFEFGQKVVAPEAPAKEGYSFDGWQNVPDVMPAHDIEVVGSYTVNQYKLTYMVDGVLYKELSLDFGAPVVPEAAPERMATLFRVGTISLTLCPLMM